MPDPVLHSYLVCQLTALLNIANGALPPGVFVEPRPQLMTSQELVREIDVYTTFLRSKQRLQWT